MQNIEHADFGIIINDDQHCAVWPAQDTPPDGWRFIAARGTRAAMQARVDQQFIPTAPAIPVEWDWRYRNAEWAAAEFGD